MPVDHKNILVELNKAVKTLNFYPKGHPNLDAILGDCLSLFKQATEEVGEIKWKVDQKGFYANDKPITSASEPVAAFAKQFFLRRISVLSFTPEITLDDLNVFISVINADAGDVIAEGGAEKIFAKKKVRGILLNETRYEDLLKMAEEAEEEEELGAEVEETEEPRPVEGQPEEEPLGELLERLKAETDALKYNDLASRLSERAGSLLSAGRFNEAYPVIKQFFVDSQVASGQPDEIRGKAHECFFQLTGPELIRHLIQKMGTVEAAECAAVQGILVGIGEDAVDPLLGTLIETHDFQTRRPIHDTLVQLGESIRGRVEAKLGSGDWITIRFMAALLGEIGSVQSMGALEEAYGHEDIRVRKEVLKAIGMISSTRSLEILFDALREGEHALQGQAIISLAMRKESSAVDEIGEIATMKDPLSENVDIRKEAIKALGIIGDDKSVEHLSSLVLNRGWFGKKTPDDLLQLVVTSLGRIGTPEAIDAIKKFSGSAKGALYNTCKRILEGREEK
ncbi:MAG: HEAT repeat domain-containing protein [Thermodesulfobacteriota bacterium]